MKNGDEEKSFEAKIYPGMKAVQGVLILVNIEEAQEVQESDLYEKKSARGSKGFGSNFEDSND